MSRLPEQTADRQPAATRSLLHGLIDYAGLFPPSKLPLDEAITRYARYREGNDAWMLSRFIIPAGKLADLQPHAGLFDTHPPFRFSVTVPPAGGFDGFLSGFRNALVHIHEFETSYGDNVKVEMIETRLPVPPRHPVNPERYLPFFEMAERAVRDELGRLVDVFFEVPWQVHFDDAFDSDYEDLFDHAAEAIRLHIEQPEGEHLPLGMKLRCGGVDPGDVPPPEIVAAAIWHAVKKDIPFKATAGLHHPVRHMREEFGGRMHGFLNVFGAGLLAREHNLSREQIEEIIRDEDPDSFTISDELFAWRGKSVPLNSIDEGRRRFTSYGSCSFDEPREDLVELGILS